MIAGPNLKQQTFELCGMFPDLGSDSLCQIPSISHLVLCLWHVAER